MFTRIYVGGGEKLVIERVSDWVIGCECSFGRGLHHKRLQSRTEGARDLSLIHGAEMGEIPWPAGENADLREDPRELKLELSYV